MTAPSSRRRPRRTALPPRTTWDTVPPHAVVRPGDLMRFAWLPAGWSEPLFVEGMVSSAADGRRTWFVSVDAVTGTPGLWRVRKQADSTLSGEPQWPADEQWWLNNCADKCTPLAMRSDSAAHGLKDQLELFLYPETG